MSEDYTITFNSGSSSVSLPRQVNGNAPLENKVLGEILEKAWLHYKEQMFEGDRPLCDLDYGDVDGDKQKDERITVSEGVSYALLRAVWMNDQDSFDKTWRWAQQHMQRKNITEVYDYGRKKWVPNTVKDALFAWRYTSDFGGRPEGGVIHDTVMRKDGWHGGREGATDADQDIAAALLFAAAKWGRSKDGRVDYRAEAVPIIKDIRAKYVIQVNGEPYLVGGDQFKRYFENGRPGEINPSYFRPYYYKLFTTADPDGARTWSGLEITSLHIMDQSADKNFSGKTGPGKANLLPNWLAITPRGELIDSPTFSQNQEPGRAAQEFGADAARALSFGLAMAFAWGNDSTAQKFLTDSTCSSSDFGPHCFFKNEIDKKIAAAAARQKGELEPLLTYYRHDGTPFPPTQFNEQDEIIMLGNLLPYFYYSGDMETTQKILQLLLNYYSEPGYFGAHDYYSQNWAWFGLALINYRPEILNPLPDVGVEDRGTVPKVFERETKYPTEHLYGRRAEIRQQRKLIAQEGWENDVARYNPRLHELDIISRLAKAQTNLFDNYSVIWILQREIGEASTDTMNTALDHRRTLYGEASRLNYIVDPLGYENRTVLERRRFEDAIILASEPTKNKEFLERLGFEVAPVSGETEKQYAFRVFLKIHEEYSKVKRPYSKLMGQLLLQLSVHASTDEVTLHYAKLTIAYFDQTIADSKSGKLSKEIERQEIYKDNREDEFKYVVAAAKMGKAQMLLLTAGYSARPDDSLRLIDAAFSLLADPKEGAALDLKGFHFLQVKQLAAEGLIRRAFILKDLGDEAGYQALLLPAKALLKDIKFWEEDYNKNVVKDEADRPLWLKQIGTYSKLWLAKIEMVEAGELRTQPHKNKIAEVLAKLTTAEKYLREIMETKAISVEDMAEVEKTLAENLTRQGFIAIDRGEDYTAFFDPAEEILARVNRSDSKAKETVKAEANLWLAKIYLVRAGKAPTEAEKKALLQTAEEKIKLALKKIPDPTAPGQEIYALKGVILSSAFQTYGDIWGANKKFAAAAEYYTLALGKGITDPSLTTLQIIFERNFEARASLADIYNWQNKYTEAEEEYAEVLRAAPPDSLAYIRAELGRLEIAMRQTKGDYSEIDVQKSAALFKKIIENEPSGRELVARALRLMIEGYSTRKIWKERIIIIGNALLKENYPTEGKYDHLIALLAQINPDALDEKFRTFIYIETAKALIDLRRFDEAETLLAKAPATENEILLARYQMARATLTLRRNAQDEKEEEVPAALDAARAAFEAADDEPFLLREAVDLALEELNGARKFSVTREAADYLLGNTNSPPQELAWLSKEKIDGAFTNQGLDEKLRDLRFDLTVAKIDALTWDEEFRSALEEIERVDISWETNAVARQTKELKLKIRRADLYRYGREVKDLSAAEKLYQKIIDQFGGKDNLNDETQKELAKAYLGLAKVKQENLRAREALALAKKALTYEFYLPVGTYNEIRRLHSSLSDPLLGSTTRVYSGQANDGRGKWFESQEELTLNLLSFQNNLFSAYLRNQLDQQADFSSGRDSLYLGLKYRPFHWLSLQVEQQLGTSWMGDAASFKYFRNPDAIFAVGLWSKYVSFLTSASVNWLDGENTKILNSYYASLTFRALKFLEDGLDWYWLRYFPLETSAGVNYYQFPLGSLRQIPGQPPTPKEVGYERNIPERVSLPIIFRLPYDAGVFSSKFGYDRLKFEPYGGPVVNFLVDKRERRDMRRSLRGDSYYTGGLAGLAAGYNFGSIILSGGAEIKWDKYYFEALGTLNLNLYPLLFSNGEEDEVIDWVLPSSTLLPPYSDPFSR